MQEVVTSLRGMKADYLPNNARPEGEQCVKYLFHVLVVSL